MSSVSSYEGSDKDSFFQRSVIDGQPPSSRHSYLRKTDLLDTLDSNSRLRDTDSWSVAATIDDQESVISAHGGPPSIISGSRMIMDRETDDDHSTLDGESSIRDHLHDIHLQDTNGSRVVDDEDDKRSRSNAAEFGDDGARSATADFDHSSVASDDDVDSRGGVHHNNVVDDQISAPPQPQPSFASEVTKSYAELVEENEILQSQLRNLQLAQKHQADMISNLRNLTGCDDELYGKALNLTSSGGSGSNKDSNNSSENSNNKKNSKSNNNEGSNIFFVDSPSLDHTQVPPIVNARTLTQKLARLAETVTRFVNETTLVNTVTTLINEEEWKLSFEQSLFLNITENYLNSLPFGTENQHLLNTAYSDQIRRFHSTLGTNFAKWYRRQTVQSLSLNPATKEYLEDMRNNLTNEMLRLLNDKNSNNEQQPPLDIWNDILELCAALSLEIHGGDADVTAQSIAVGSKFDEEIMALVGDMSNHENKLVKMVISPLFVDEEEVVLLPARVVLE